MSTEVNVRHSEDEPTEMLEFAPKKDLLVEEVPAPKMGDLDSFEIHLAG